ncbi:hypothetical protein MKW98_029719 [Papaver atlanticum]|uniref:Uncharacterized protein n=1 Tax=Papaver atlanticum TaxID=357466 RepID=A0AAD4T682_9MAGN|nr:hypothetical protein MKW98_029719 [Papaver atlanticum]
MLCVFHSDIRGHFPISMHEKLRKNMMMRSFKRNFVSDFWNFLSKHLQFQLGLLFKVRFTDFYLTVKKLQDKILR